MNHYKTILFLSFLLTPLLFTACQNDIAHKEAEAVPAEEIHEEQELVKISPVEAEEFGIILEVAAPGRLDRDLFQPGEVVIPPDNLAHLHPRFPGIVKEVRKHIGEPVKKGEVLAIIESNESLTDYSIKSLIDGILLEKHLSLGEVVEDHQHGMVVADLSELWVYLKIYQQDLPFIKQGQAVTISADATMPTIESKISYISPVIDEMTRTATARIIISNPDPTCKPGLFVTGRIHVSHLDIKLAIPKTAVQTLEGKPTVFIQTADGFEARHIKIGRSDETTVEVTDGLNTGETYVSRGGFTLKAELLKSEFHDGHNH